MKFMSRFHALSVPGALLAGIFAAIAASPAIARDPMRIELPAGEVEIRVDEAEGFGIIVSAPGQPDLPVESAYLPEVIASHADSVLLQLSSGGNACPAEYAWLTYDAAGLRATPAFGTCSEGVEMVETGGYPAATMPPIGEETGWSRYDFDGQTVTRSDLGQKASGISPATPAAWEGHSAYDLVVASEIHPRLAAIMGEEDIGLLSAALQLTSDTQNLHPTGVPSGGAHSAGDWLVGSGCRPSLCDVEAAAVGLNLTDGRIVAVLFGLPEDPPRYFGADPAEAQAVLSPLVAAAGDPQP